MQSIQDEINLQNSTDSGLTQINFVGISTHHYREWAAVNEWLRSNRTYHVMRDHFGHHVPMCGGLWGMRFTNKSDRWKIANIFDQMLLGGGMWMWGMDQTLLTEYLWPTAKQDMVAHDSWFCEVFRSPMNRPFPVKRNVGPRNFVGSSHESQEIVMECPFQCRPRDHPDWTLC